MKISDALKENIGCYCKFEFKSGETLRAWIVRVNGRVVIVNYNGEEFVVQTSRIVSFELV